MKSNFNETLIQLDREPGSTASANERGIVTENTIFLQIQ